MDEKFSGFPEETAIVTGASSGTGLATAWLLAENGVKPGLLTRSKGILEEISGTLPGLPDTTGEIVPETERVGIVCPVYFAALPVIVAGFAGRPDLPSAKYVFAVITPGGSSALHAAPP
jgi:NAD(P)-dependent dehydrogenase (short-subunit alcohol dehydrogenase family)